MLNSENITTNFFFLNERFILKFFVLLYDWVYKVLIQTLYILMWNFNDIFIYEWKLMVVSDHCLLRTRL